MSGDNLYSFNTELNFILQAKGSLDRGVTRSDGSFTVGAAKGISLVGASQYCYYEQCNINKAGITHSP